MPVSADEIVEPVMANDWKFGAPSVPWPSRGRTRRSSTRTAATSGSAAFGTGRQLRSAWPTTVRATAGRWLARDALVRPHDFGRLFQAPAGPWRPQLEDHHRRRRQGTAVEPAESSANRAEEASSLARNNDEALVREQSANKGLSL